MVLLRSVPAAVTSLSMGTKAHNHEGLLYFLLLFRWLTLRKFLVFYEITYYIQKNYPKLMFVVNYFEKIYLGSVTVDSEERVAPAYPLEFWNHFARIVKDPEFPEPRTWWRAFTEVSKPECIARSPLFKSMLEQSRSSRTLPISISTGSVLVRLPRRRGTLAILCCMISAAFTLHSLARWSICLLLLKCLGMILSNL